MKRGLLVLLIVLFSMNAKTQKSYAHFGVKGSTIYDSKIEKTSCSCNFKNLFKNWGPRYVTNYNDFELISFKLIKTITDTISIEKCIKELLVSPATVSFNILGTSYLDTKNNKIKYYSFIEPRYFKNQFLFKTERNSSRNSASSVRSQLKELIEIGDKVYCIRFKFKNKPFEVFVVCHPNNKTVFIDPGFLKLKCLY